jgi:phosphohistidine swiveling domain-containing protein
MSQRQQKRKGLRHNEVNRDMPRTFQTWRRSTDAHKNGWLVHKPENQEGSTPARKENKEQFVLRASEVADRSLAGGKAYALACLLDTFAEVPAWFVITPAAFEASLNQQQREVFKTQGCTRQLLDSLNPSPRVRQQVSTALQEIVAPDELVAVRSSAVEEDSALASFAGQLESFLCVSSVDIWQRIADVWRSGFSERVQVYREQKGLRGRPHPPAVLVQRMVPAEISGIAFSTDPVSGDRNQCVVSATKGHGDRLVGGLVQGDVYHISRQGRIVSQPEEKGHAKLTENQVRRVAQLARRLEEHFGHPQDVEWAFAGDTLFLLQSRPITTLAKKQPGDATLWDNSNIVESYCGVTSPLTFSFARHVYEGVYRQFVLNLGVSHNEVAGNEELFRNMLGYLDGRVYYNLLNWYRMLALLPGSSHNRRFLDLMLGVREGLSAEHEQQLARYNTDVGRVRSFLAWGRLTTRILWNWLTLRSRTNRFYVRLEAALSLSLEELQALPLDELVRYYRSVERQLLKRWDAPVLNDFYCMIFFGLSRQLLRRWGGPDAEALHGAFLQRKEGMISTEPAQRIVEMAALVAKDHRLRKSLLSTDTQERTAAIEANSQFKAAYEAYLDRFGDRCLEELKLESATTRDDPTSLLRTIAYRSRHAAPVELVTEDFSPKQALRKSMRGKPLRRAVAVLLLSEAARRVRGRENLRFERTRLFARARQTFLQIGKRLTDAGMLSHLREIFFLEVDEVLGAVEGTATIGNLSELVRLRMAEHERFLTLPERPTRFETHGAVISALGQVHSLPASDTQVTDDGERCGLACSPGQVRGTARVIVDPRGASIRPGEILVAKYTDPGWVLLFTTALGVVVERGSLLSHSAIVARELGIPAVVAVPGVTSWLHDGDEIELDGGRGTVRRLNRDGTH